MSTTPSKRRHEPLSVIENYLGQGVPGVFSVPGTPSASFLIDPGHNSLAIRLTATGPSPDLSGFRNLRFNSVLDGTQMADELVVILEDNTDEAYAWLCSILDRVQLAAEPFTEAIERAVDSLAGLMAMRRGLSKNQRIGLFGELLILIALADQIGPLQAVSAWLGPLGEEHDFGLVDSDLEVKTTMSERREHWISGVSQLLPTGDRALFLVSVQLTTAGVSAGQTLSELVDCARVVFKAHQKPMELLLGKVGYADRDAELYGSRWTMRGTPAFYEVVGKFPALTQARLDSAVPSSGMVTEVRYRLDLTGMAPSQPLLAFDGPEFLAEVSNGV